MIRRIVLLLALSLAVCLPTGVVAVAQSTTPDSGLPSVFADYYPPTPDTVMVTQPNGRSFPASLTPATFGGALEYTGYSVMRRTDGWWVYAAGRGAQGHLVPTAARVLVDPRPVGLTPGNGRTSDAFAAEDGSDVRAEMFRQLQVASAQAMQQAQAAGTQRVFRFPVVLLATWWDADKGQTEPQFQEGDTAAKYQALLSGFGGNPHGTLTEFYLENSYNQFKVIVDVYGPYTSQRSRQDRCYYGGTDVPDSPYDDLDPIDNAVGIGGLGAVGMAIEAVPQSDPDIDYSQYDNDGDGYVDFMGIMHSGPDMAGTGDPCQTWSHAMTVSQFGDIATGLAGLPAGTLQAGLPTSDGVLVDRVFTMPEIGFQIGVASHEMAHALGEPDYYNTTYASMGTGDWDIMAGGSWLGNPAASNPTGFNPASRVFQGWMGSAGSKVRIINGDVRGLKLRPRELFPDLALVPVTKIAVGQTDKYGHTWTDTDVYGLVKTADGKYVVEGYYLENWSRSVNGKALPGFKRAPYFDRAAWASGQMAWHFDYYKRSNTYDGANNGQNDPNRPQMDPMEFDWNDNTQELQLNLVRGEASDLVSSAAAGIGSGTRQLAPGIAFGTPQAGSTFEGVLPPAQTADHPFTVQDNPANEKLMVTAVGMGDCTLQVFRKNADGSTTAVSDKADSGSVADEELITITKPKPGDYLAQVGDFAACGQYSGAIKFESGSTGFQTTGAADTWSNWTQKPTGWAFTHVRPAAADGIEGSVDTSPSGTITLDVLKLGATRTELAPGFARPATNSLAGRVPVVAKRANAFSVPVFNNGGKAVEAATVQVRVGSPNGKVIATRTVALGGYKRKEVGFSYTPAREGAYQLFVSVDPGRKVAEAVESNNVQRVTGWAGPVSPRVLVVDDDAYDAESAYAGTLAALHIPYAIATGHVTAATMARFKAVIWETGLERGVGVMDEKDQAAVTTYLDGGGKVLLTSLRAVDALAGTDLLTKYFGTELTYLAGDDAGYLKGSSDLLGTARRDLLPFENRPVQGYFHVASGVKGKVTKLADYYVGSQKLGLIGIKVDGAKWQTAYLAANLTQFGNVNDAAAVLGPILKSFGVGKGGYQAPSTPTIYHSAVRHATAGSPVHINAVVLGTSKAPTVSYRRHGSSTWVTVAMKNGAFAGTWYAVIPGKAVTASSVDYVIRAGGVTHPISAPRVAHLIAVAPAHL